MRTKTEQSLLLGNPILEKEMKEKSGKLKEKGEGKRRARILGGEGLGEVREWDGEGDIPGLGSEAPNSPPRVKLQ